MTIYEALLAINLLTFVTFGYDKWQAKRGGWRVPEANLLLFSLIGGALAGYAAMSFFRHKTRKPKFKLLLPLFMLLHIILLGYIAAGGQIA